MTDDERKEAIATARQTGADLIDLADVLETTPTDHDTLHVERIRATGRTWGTFLDAAATGGDQAIALCRRLDAAAQVVCLEAKAGRDGFEKEVARLRRFLPVVPLAFWREALSRWERGKWHSAEPGAPRRGEVNWSHDVFSLLTRAGLTNSSSAAHVAKVIRARLKQREKL